MHQQGMGVINWLAKGFGYRSTHYQRYWASVIPSVFSLTLRELNRTPLSL